MGLKKSIRELTEGAVSAFGVVCYCTLSAGELYATVYRAETGQNIFKLVFDTTNITLLPSLVGIKPGLHEAV